MTVDLRTICRLIAVAAVFCTLTLAAPVSRKTITYDQRQNGEFNLQVDLEDVALLFLPGDDFLTRRSGLLGNKMFQMYERRHNGNSRKKQKNCSTTTEKNKPEKTTTEKNTPDNNNYGTGQTSGSSSTNTDFENNIPETQAGQQEQDGPSAADKLSVQLSSAVESSADVKFGSEENAITKPSGVAPSYSSDIPSPSTISNAEVKPVEDNTMVAVKTLSRPTPASETDDSITVAAESDGKPEALIAVNTVTKSPSEMVIVKTVEKPVEVKVQPESAQASATESISKSQNTDAVVAADVKPVVADKPVEMVVVKTLDKLVEPILEDAQALVADSAVKSSNSIVVLAVDAIPKSVEKSVVADKPVDMVVVKTVKKPDEEERPETIKETDKAVEFQGNTFGPKISAGTVDTLKQPDRPTESVGKSEETAVKKTTEKASVPVKSSEIQVSGKKTVRPVESVGTMTTADNNVKSEMVVMKTVDNLSAAAPTKAVAEKLVATAVKAAETHSVANDKHGQVKSSGNAADMVIVKTVDNPATPAVMSVKTTVSMKAVVKPSAANSKTSSVSTGNTSSRKVGDRKPLPEVTIQVAPSTLVTA